MDIKGAYLNGKLKETIYMEQPQGYSNGISRICQLIKTLYRLKQSGWEWNEELDTKLSGIRFKCLYMDPCIYIWCEGNSIEIITVWVDNLLLFTNSKETMVKLKNDLKKLFNITDLGEPNKLVGLEFMHNREWGTLTIRQTQYIENLLKKYLMHDGSAMSTLLDPNLKLKPCKLSAEPASQYGNYASLIGSLMYATIRTRPKIAYTVNKLCSFNSNPDLVHWTAAKRVLCYLRGMKELGITYTNGGTKGKFYGYADASFTNNHDLTSTSGNVFILNGGTIAWSSKKELTPALSTAEAEFNSTLGSSFVRFSGPLGMVSLHMKINLIGVSSLMISLLIPDLSR